MRQALAALALLAVPAIALADSPRIEAANATQGAGGWQFTVTLYHPDTGWDHYADGWRVLDMNGNELGMRPLAHPHTNEQPFTRSLGDIAIPDGVTQVQIQARCNVDGWSSETYPLTLR